MKKMLLLVCILLCLSLSAFAAETTYTGTLDSISITEAGEHTVILNGVTVEHGDGGGMMLAAPATKVTIVLKDGTVNALTGHAEFAGISTYGVDLVIRCERAGEGHVCDENCGTLIAKGGTFAAGIGGNDGGEDGATRYDFNSKVIVIGGNVTAVGAAWGAGIGGGATGDMEGEVIVTGGNVTAIGGKYSAGIGGGEQGAMSGKFTVTGGSVIALGGEGFDDEYLDAIGAGDYDIVKEEAVIEVNPAVNKIAVKAGADESSAAEIDGSAFAARTSLKSALKGKRYVHFQYIAPPATPAPSPTPAPEIPATGDGTNFALLAVMIVASVIVMSMILRRKNEA